MNEDRPSTPGTQSEPGFWPETSSHRKWLKDQAMRQLEFFSASCRKGPGFFILDNDGNPQPGQLQELHTTTRLIHS